MSANKSILNAIGSLTFGAGICPPGAASRYREHEKPSSPARAVATLLTNQSGESSIEDQADAKRRHACVPFAEDGQDAAVEDVFFGAPGGGKFEGLKGLVQQLTVRRKTLSTPVAKIKDTALFVVRRVFMPALIAMAAGLTSCSNVQQGALPATEGGSQLPDKEQVEEYLGWRFSECRHVHFQKPTVTALGEDYLTWIYFEVGEEELKSLLSQSEKLADYESLKVNEVNLKFMRQTGTELAWWNFEKLQDAVCGTTSWCTHYENGNCVLYGSSTVATARTGGKWLGVYIVFSQEALPALP